MEGLKRISDLCDVITAYNGKLSIKIGEYLTNNSTPELIRNYVVYMNASGQLLLHQSNLRVYRKYLVINRALDPDIIKKYQQKIRDAVANILTSINTLVTCMEFFKSSAPIPEMRLSDIIENFKLAIARIHKEISISKIEAISEIAKSDPDIKQNYKVVVGGRTYLGGGHQDFILNFIDSIDEYNNENVRDLNNIIAMFSTGLSLRKLSYSVCENLIRTLDEYPDLFKNLEKYVTDAPPGTEFADKLRTRSRFSETLSNRSRFSDLETNPNISLDRAVTQVRDLHKTGIRFTKIFEPNSDLFNLSDIVDTFLSELTRLLHNVDARDVALITTLLSCTGAALSNSPVSRTEATLSNSPVSRTEAALSNSPVSRTEAALSNSPANHPSAPLTNPDARKSIKNDVHQLMNKLFENNAQLRSILSTHIHILNQQQPPVINNMNYRTILQSVRSVYVNNIADLIGEIEKISDNMASDAKDIKTKLDTLMSPGFKLSCVKNIATYMQQIGETPGQINLYAGSFA